MGYESVHTASATGDDQELRRCIEGLDVDRDGLFNRHDPEPRVVVGRPPGSHGRFNEPTPAAVRGSFGDTPLHKAAMAGQSVALGYLLSVAASGGLKVPVDGGLGLGLDGDDEYRSKIISAAFRTDADAGEVTVANDLTADALEARQREPDEDAMQVLARLVHARNDAGQTPLHLAALHGNYTCVQMLIAAKSDVNAADTVSGMTPLHAAVRMDHMRVVMLLLDGMADPNAPDLQGGTPMHMAARFDIAPAVRLLAGSGSMLDGQRSQDHYTPLHLSCRYNTSTDTVLALLDARADPTLLSRAGQPPALIAATLGDEHVLEVVSEAHWRLCLENPDGEGLSRIKGGGNLTARALFDKAMQRQCWQLSLPDQHGKWYNSTFEYAHSWRSDDGELSVELPTDEEGVARGKWVAPGPLSDEALELAVSHSFGEALDLLKAKVGSFTPVEKIEELVSVELSAPARALRTANQHWWSGRRAREEFDFEGAERSFKAAAKIFASDWWGIDGTDAATTLALEMIQLKELKADLDARMVAGDRYRTHFDFKEAAAEYAGVSEKFASYGHADRAFEAYYRLKEVESKSVLRSEAEDCIAAAKRESLTATELPEYPNSRLMIMEAVVHLKRACKIFKQYGDTATYKATKSRLTAAQWNLEKQNKAYAHLVHGNSLMSWVARGPDYERKADTHTVYLPSEDYIFDNNQPKVLMMLQIEEAVSEFRSALAYLADIGDEKVHKLAADNQEEAEKLLEIQRDAHRHMQQGQDVEMHFTPDANMQGKFLVFGQIPSAQDAEALCLPGRQPYKGHAVGGDYPFRDAALGLVYHRKRVREGMEAYRHAKECFALLPDEENRQEAERQEARLLDRLRTQSEGNRLLVEAHQCVLQRQYADAAEKFKQASIRMTGIEDERNAEYIQALSDDARVKRGIADTAHGKMRKGQELLEQRESFERWEDVVDRGLPAFAEAEQLFREASDLFADLDQGDNAHRASERETESLERKTHAQELKESFVVVVQPSGDLAPQRRDTTRRTMGYATAIHALRDAATDGFTSTYHTRSEILEGSSVFLRKGVHEFEETIRINRNVTVRAEDGVVADDCSMTIKNVSLLLSQASSVKLVDVTLNQLVGDGSEDYWSGGLYVVMVTAGYLEATNCFVYSQRGCGVVARHSGKATLINSIVDGCGQYGVGADGPDTIIDLRGCTIEASKFEDTDERNGGRVIGYEEED